MESRNGRRCLAGARLVLLCTGLILSAMAVSAPAESVEPGVAVAVPTPAFAEAAMEEKLSYFFGYSFGNMMKQSGIDSIDFDQIRSGIVDSLDGIAPAMSDAEQAGIVEEIQKRQGRVQDERQRVRELALTRRLTEAQAFMRENQTRPGVISTASGLQYEVLKDGTGASPTVDQHVEVHYVGTLTDGTEFDNTRERDKTASFSLGGVIPGWTEGMQLMKVGGLTRMTIPPELGYGPEGRPSIPPNAVLIFEIELIAVN